MARSARCKSETGVYHVLLRSMAGGFFHDSEDFEKFSVLLKQNKNECGYFLYAFVLLREEIRLLIKLQNSELETIFKKLCIKYSYWYNCKYHRHGAVFFDRFKSEPVNYEDIDDVLRYIVRYPEKTGTRYDLYPYSSFSINDGIDFYKTLEDDFFSIKSQKDYLTMKAVTPKITDEEAMKWILAITEVSSVDEAIKINYSENADYIKQMIDSGVGYRQITRILGLSYITIKKAVSGENKSSARPKDKSEKSVQVNIDEAPEHIDFFLL